MGDISWDSWEFLASLNLGSSRLSSVPQVVRLKAVELGIKFALGYGSFVIKDIY